MKNPIRFHGEGGVYILLCTLMWGYLIMRAFLVPMVDDEIATFFFYVQTADFMPFTAHFDMNNHFINKIRFIGLQIFLHFHCSVFSSGKLLPFSMINIFAGGFSGT